MLWLNYTNPVKGVIMKNIDEKYFKFSNDTIIRKPEDLLTEGEKVLWRGKPKKSAYVLGKSIALMPIALIWGLIDITIIISVLSFGSLPGTVYLFLLGFFALHLAPVWLWLGSMIKAAKEMNSIQYMITDKRIVEVRGRKSLYFHAEIKLTEIKETTLKISFIDRILKVGDIYISGDKSKSIVLFDIPNSEFIRERIEKLVHDTKEGDNKKSAFYKNNHECAHCGSYYDSSKHKCPMCGAPANKK